MDIFFYSLLVDTAALEDDLEILQEHTPWLVKEAKRHGNKLFQAIALRALAVSSRLGGKHKHAHEQLEEAEVIFKDMNTDWQLGRTYYEFGQLSAAQDRSDEAKKHFEQAVAHFENMGALPDIKRTQSAIESLIS